MVPPRVRRRLIGPGAVDCSTGGCSTGGCSTGAGSTGAGSRPPTGFTVVGSAASAAATSGETTGSAAPGQRGPGCDGQRSTGGVAVGRLLRQRRRGDLIEGRRQRGNQGRWCRRRAVQVPVHPGRNGLTRVGNRPGQQLVEHAAQGIDVGSVVEHLALDLFRRGVVQGGDHAPGAGQRGDAFGGLTDGLGHPEVGQEDLFGLLVVVRPRGQQDVGGLDVPVQQLVPVRVVERGRDLADDADRPVRRHAALGIVAQRILGVAAVDEAHADPQLAVLRSPVVHRHDVRVVELRDGVGFPLESTDEAGIGAEFGAEQLQRVEAGQPGVSGQVHRAHPARTEFALDRVAGEDLTRP